MPRSVAPWQNGRSFSPLTNQGKAVMPPCGGIQPSTSRWSDIKRSKKLEVSNGDFPGLAEHNVTFADCDFRKNFSRGGVADREVGARVPVLLAALGVVLDHPSCAHAGNRKCLRQVGDHGGVRQPRRRFRLPSVVDGMVDLVTHQLDSALGGEVVQGFHFVIADGRARGVVRAVNQDELGPRVDESLISSGSMRKPFSRRTR